MKIVAILVIIFGFFIIGCMLADYYKKRNKLFEDLLYFCDLLVGDISFLQHKLINIVDCHLNTFSVSFQNILIKFKSYLDNVITSQELQKYIVDNNLINVNEANEIYKFLTTLGRLDVDNELRNIKNYKQLFVKFANCATKESEKYVPMFLKLSLIFGCVIAVLLI